MVTRAFSGSHRGWSPRPHRLFWPHPALHRHHATRNPCLGRRLLPSPPADGRRLNRGSGGRHPQARPLPPTNLTQPTSTSTFTGASRPPAGAGAGSTPPCTCEPSQVHRPCEDLDGSSGDVRRADDSGTIGRVGAGSATSLTGQIVDTGNVARYGVAVHSSPLSQRRSPPGPSPCCGHTPTPSSAAAGDPHRRRAGEHAHATSYSLAQGVPGCGQDADGTAPSRQVGYGEAVSGRTV